MEIVTVFKPDDVTMSEIWETLSDSISDSFIFHTWKTFHLEKNQWFLGSRQVYVARLSAQFYAAIRKLLKDFWLLLLEQTIKLVLRYNYTMRFIGYDFIQARWFISYRFQIRTVT